MPLQAPWRRDHSAGCDASTRFPRVPSAPVSAALQRLCSGFAAGMLQSVPGSDGSAPRPSRAGAAGAPDAARTSRTDAQRELVMLKSQSAKFRPRAPNFVSALLQGSLYAALSLRRSIYITVVDLLLTTPRAPSARLARPWVPALAELG